MARRFGGLSARSQGAVFALLTLSVLLGAWQTWLSPERLLLDSRRSRRDAMVTELARLRRTASGLPNLHRAIKELEARLAEQAAGGPDISEPDTLLEAIHELATQSALELITFTHASAAGEAKSGKQQIRIGLDGRFQAIVAFLARLNASGRLASAPDLTIKPHGKPSADRTITAGIVVDVKSPATPIARADVVSAFELTRSARDPFLPTASGSSAGSAGHATAGARGAVAGGVSGVSANDVTVTGIVRAGDFMTALLQASDRRTFVVRPQDQLLDAIVKSVDEAGVVFAVRTPRGGPPQPGDLRKTLARFPGAVR